MDVLYGIGGALVLQLVAFIFFLGKLYQKVDSIDRRINNGYTCKYHAQFAQDIGEIRGRICGGRENE